MDQQDEKALSELKARLGEARDLEEAGALLFWDQQTYMPEGGAAARARHMATLTRLAHEKATDPEIGRLLDRLQPRAESLSAEDADLLRVARRDYDRATKVPPDFVAEMNRHFSETYQVWAKSRPANDFKAVEPYLERTVDFSRRYADFFPGYEHIADPLIDTADPGLPASTIGRLFADLRRELVPLVQTVTSQPPADDACLRQHFPEADQWRFGLDVAKQIGYDLERGREDKTPHPFTISFSIGDVRITTRVNEDDLREALFGTIHESGHALYEQAVASSLEGSPLAGGTSSGVHESQSRLWENLVGRSRSFWEYFYPKLQAVFPSQLGDVPLDTYYRAINKVQRSLIRVEADELTYNLHIMLRFDLELALLEGKLAVKDLPEVWRERMKQDVGIEPPDDRDGVLQDVHWYFGTVGGAFQGYTLGNVMSAAFLEAAGRAHPEIPAEISRGEFSTLLGWLRENIYQYGRRIDTLDLVERVTGAPLDIGPYIRYLRGKYGELYQL